MNGPTHLELLATSRELLCSAVRHDVEALVSIVSRFRDQLDAHVASEDPDIVALPDRAEVAVHVGQRRLRQLLDLLLVDLERSRSDAAAEPATNWLGRATEVQLVLRHQAVLEALVLRRQRLRVEGSRSGGLSDSRPAA